MTNVTFGTDPEMFIYDTENQKVVSSIGLIPGEKEEPAPVEGLPEGFCIEKDNVLVEFTTPPANTTNELRQHIETMMSFLDLYVKKLNSNYTVKAAASMECDPAILDNPIAQLFGCDPDFNAYTQTENPKPEGDKTNLRSAGFHLHFGYPNASWTSNIKVVQYCDAYLGVPSLLYDDDNKRRSLYGKAGAFRQTEYGVEYRTLSSEMLNHLDVVMKQIMTMWNAYENNLPLPPADEVISAINNTDIALAKKLIEKYNLI